MFRRLTLLLALSLPASAQPLPDRAPIRGLVVDETGQPVAAAVLTIRRQDDAGTTAFWGGEARTDDKGKFDFARAEVGRYFVNVEAPGYAPLYNYALDWMVGAAPPRLELRHLARLTVRAAFPKGSILSRVPAWIRGRSAEGNIVSLRVESDDEGQITLSDLPPSIYSVVVVGTRGLAVQNGVNVNARAVPAPLDVELRAGASLRITAKDTDGKPLGGAALVLFAQSPEEAARLGGQGADASENWALLAAGGAPQAIVTSEGDGVLTLPHLPPGRYSARLTLPGFGTQSRDLTLADGAQTAWDANFPAKSVPNATFRIMDGAGHAVADTFVALRMLPLAPDGTFGAPAMMPPEPNAPPDLPLDSPSNGARVGRTDKNGVLFLYPLRPGKYRVWASRPGPESWIYAPVAPEGPPADIVITQSGANSARLQVP